MHGPRAVGVLALGAGQCCLAVGSAVLSTALLIVLMDPLPSPCLVMMLSHETATPEKLAEPALQRQEACFH